jgi:hypothetical protein
VLTRDEIVATVRRDVEQSLGRVFADGPGFQLLDIPLAGDRDPAAYVVPSPVTFVAWEWRGTHVAPLGARVSTDAHGRTCAVIDHEPARTMPCGPVAPTLPPTQRDVRVVGATAVLARDRAEEQRPKLMRFIDWASVFHQLGYGLEYETVVT